MGDCTLKTWRKLQEERPWDLSVSILFALNDSYGPDSVSTMSVVNRVTQCRRFASRSLLSRSFSAHNEAPSGSNPEESPVPSVHRTPVRPFPLSATKPVPPHIVRPPYASSGIVPYPQHADSVYLHEPEVQTRMKAAAKLARRTLDLACSLAQPGVTTDEIDTHVHEAIIAAGAYPSPLNYAGFPKSLCSSINEVICHGIPDERPLEFGDVVSFDVSCFLNGVHGDNCATVIVGDVGPSGSPTDWRGVPYRTQFASDADEAHFVHARRLVAATREALYAAIETVRPGSCLTQVGAAIHAVADQHGYDTVQKYRGHGICHEFHCAPFVKHFRNRDTLELLPGMIFTIEPMLTEGSQECHEWSDQWTVATNDNGLAAQFEHTVLVTEDGVEIITVPE